MGFVKKTNTINQIIRLESTLPRGFHKKAVLGIVYFDLEKDYDTTWRYGVMTFCTKQAFEAECLYLFQNVQQIGTFQFGLVVLCLKYMIKNRVVLRVAYWLSHYLLLKYIAYNGVDGSLYVNEYLMCNQSKHMNTIERQLQLYLHTIQKWADENGFKFSQTRQFACILPS